MKQEPARILVVDDEVDLVWALRHTLSDEGYEVLSAYDGLEGLALARRYRPDLIILDILMPKANGLEVCRTLRRDPDLAAVPILFLTVRADKETTVAGLDEGGDDYLVKPFNAPELLARVRALLRRIRPTAGAAAPQELALTVGALTLDLNQRQARAGNRVANLTPMEFDLLHYLMLHSNEVLSARHLVERLWTYIPTHAALAGLRWHIRNLRAKIEPDPAHPMYLCNVPRHGYILVGEGS